jgi:lambda repressor-like predicted transcriptional regulator
MRSQKKWHWEDIKAALRKEHGSLSAFEDKRNLPKNSVKDVGRGRASRSTAEVIASELGVEIHALFPGRYRSTSTKVDSRPQNASAHRLSAEVN